MTKMKQVFTLMLFGFALCTANIAAQHSEQKVAEDKSFPVVISAPRPAYPIKALTAKVEGETQVDVKIDINGKVIETAFVKGNELFKEVVLDAAQKWRFNEISDDSNNRNARLTFTFYLTDENYEETNIEEIKYKYRLNIYFQPIMDCFDKCNSNNK